MSMPGRDDGTWFFLCGMDRETYETLRRLDTRRSSRDREQWLSDRSALDRAGVTSTSGALSPATRRLAEAVVEAGRAAVAAARSGDASQEEKWEAQAHIAGRVWLGVRVLDGISGLPDEDRSARHAYVRRIHDELRAFAGAPPTRHPHLAPET
ncbi:hypothetical protein V1460_19735 [Streptomyces sp. SCSIO 30461]|uniref:hypothetical protein n=1 Tax=Streptomyces sp. SCSIO 30461 TaxID=3118085 RepID=UPI0030CB9FF1